MKIVTVTDPGFFRGTRVLIASLLQHSGLPDLSFLVVHEGLTDEHRRQLTALGGNIEFMAVDQIGGFQVPANKLPAHKRKRLKKLSIFASRPGEKLIYFDSDMLCVGPMPELASFGHFTASLDLGFKAFRPVGGYPMFNSGFMVFESSHELFADLQSFATSEHFAGKADQFLINDFMHRTTNGVRIAHSKFNLPISVKYANPSLFRDFTKQGVGMLHFTNLKPWNLRARDQKGKDNVRNLFSVVKAAREYRAWFQAEHAAKEITEAS